MTKLTDISAALEASWGPDTAFNRGEWTKENNARGQCVVSSLVVQDYLGGELLRCAIDNETLHETHYFNQLQDGTLVDTTKNQYTELVSMKIIPVAYEGFSSIREKRLSDDDTRQRYELLKQRVDSYLASCATDISS